ncbi:MAG: DUF1015 domain-containing protein [Spirochaetaceae bacterium]|jgi:hypothetical protein|nr:DUF1015 domain-containing protein [Spirochaetaceae bacterium]
MQTILARLDELGVTIPEILIPSHEIDIEKWAVVACDQWTQDRTYWQKVEEWTHGYPSTLNMIFPEVYLGDGAGDKRVESIHHAMRSYLNDNYLTNPVLMPPRNAGIFVERECKRGIRSGFLLAVDLEKYDWRSGTNSLIKASEETIEDRIPPRMKVREAAPLECPHIMLLIDDEENILMSLFEKLMAGAPFAYKGLLMFDSGGIQGKLVYRKNDWEFICDTLQFLYRRSVTTLGEENAFLFAVGDGNHSLATAKAVWEKYKAEHAGEPGLEKHKARYAIAEVVNLHDSSLEFEPIHRVLINIKAEEVIDSACKNHNFSVRTVTGIVELIMQINNEIIPGIRYGIITHDSYTLLSCDGDEASTVYIEPVIQDLLNRGSSKSEKTAVDYIHGVDELLRITAKTPNSVGIILPPFRRMGLFKTIAKNGPLPRKSFSLGNAEEKRFYLECRKLFC